MKGGKGQSRQEVGRVGIRGEVKAESFTDQSSQSNQSNQSSQVRFQGSILKSIQGYSCRMDWLYWKGRSRSQGMTFN